MTADESEKNNSGVIKSNTNPLRSIWLPDPKRPVFSALLEAELERFDKFFDTSLFIDSRKFKTDDEVKEFLNDYLKLILEGIEILEWIFPEGKTSSEDALKITNALKEAGAPKDIWMNVIKRADKRRKGRPITKRQIAVKALELKLSDPDKWSYQKLAQRLCNCEKSNHDNSCSQSLRQTMLQLKKVLKKYCPNYPL